MNAQTFNERAEALLLAKFQRYRNYLCGPVPGDLHYGEIDPRDRIIAETMAALRALINEGITELDKELLSRYQDENDDQAKETNAWNDYARFQLGELRQTFGIEATQKEQI